MFAHIDRFNNTRYRCCNRIRVKAFLCLLNAKAPYEAVYYDGMEAYVYTVVDGKAKKTYVTTGLYDTERIVISEGLSGTDMLITTWSAQTIKSADTGLLSASFVTEFIIYQSPPILSLPQ